MFLSLLRKIIPALTATSNFEIAILTVGAKLLFRLLQNNNYMRPIGKAMQVKYVIHLYVKTKEPSDKYFHFTLIAPKDCL